MRWLAPGGRFRRNWAELSAAWLGRLIPPEEVVLEFRAQVARVRELGADIDHLDTHQHLHLLPNMTSIVEVLAAELGVPVRWPQERAAAVAARSGVQVGGAGNTVAREAAAVFRLADPDCKYDWEGELKAGLSPPRARRDRRARHRARHLSPADVNHGN